MVGAFLLLIIYTFTLLFNKLIITIMPDPVPDPIIRKQPHPVTGECEEGWVLHQDGYCYPAEIEPIEPCPRGQHRDENGDCAPD